MNPTLNIIIHNEAEPSDANGATWSHPNESKPQSLTFSKEIITIGKSIDCDVYLASDPISRLHAQIYWDQHVWKIKDCQSTNGTWMNGKKIKIHALREMDEISISRYRLRFHFPRDQNEAKDHFTEDLKRDLQKSHALNLAKPVLVERLSSKLSSMIQKNNIQFASTQEKESYISGQLREILGLGNLEEYVLDSTISEIMINGLHSFYIEREGKLISLDPVIPNMTTLYTIIDRILSPLGRQVDEASPMVDARLPDGSRIHVVLPPIALFPILTIRKFSKTLHTLEDLIDKGTISSHASEILKKLVTQKENILISGQTSSGKTTLLNILCQSIPPGARIITIEESLELSLSQPHTISLETRRANIEGRGEIPMQALIQNALRMRPDRIIIGECRGKEAFDMVTAMNTGHEGGMTTCHANSPRDSLKRLETMILMANYDLPICAVRELIVSAMDVIIQMDRTASGHRELTHITQICGMEGQTILTNDIFNSTQGDTHDTRISNHEPYRHI